MFIRSFPLLGLLLSAAACTGAPPHSPTTLTSAGPPPLTPETSRLYRLDFTVTKRAHGAADDVQTYTMNVGENRRGSLMAGAGIPLTTTATTATRTDTGIKIQSWYDVVSSFDVRNADLLLHVELELTREAGNATLGKIRANNDALVSAGHSSIVASMDDPETHARYEITAMATRLR